MFVCVYAMHFSIDASYIIFHSPAREHRINLHHSMSRDAEPARHNYVLKRRKRKEETISKIDDVTCSFFCFHFSGTLSCTLRAKHGKRNGSACIVRRMSPMFQTNSLSPPPHYIYAKESRSLAHSHFSVCEKLR